MHFLTSINQNPYYYKDNAGSPLQERHRRDARQMREAYRLNKQILTPSDTCFQIAFNYIDKKQVSYPLIDKAVRKALHRLIEDKG